MCRNTTLPQSRRSSEQHLPGVVESQSPISRPSRSTTKWVVPSIPNDSTISSSERSTSFKHVRYAIPWWSASQWHGDKGRIRTQLTHREWVLQSRSWTPPFMSPNRPREVLLVDGDCGHGLFSAWVHQPTGSAKRGCERRSRRRKT